MGGDLHRDPFALAVTVLRLPDLAEAASSERFEERIVSEALADLHAGNSRVMRF